VEVAVDDNIRFSGQGVPQWFSPRHAGEKFKEICMDLAKLAMDAEKDKSKGFAKRVWDIQELAEEQAKYYFTQCPVDSVRIMQPSGAIFVILADGREVLVPQPAEDE
jgi:hypothetical protein